MSVKQKGHHRLPGCTFKVPSLRVGVWGEKVVYVSMFAYVTNAF